VRILVRAILIPLGYIAALFTATALIALVVWLRAYPPVAGDEVALGMTSVIVLADWFILYVLIGQAAVLPALAAVLVAEFLSLRHALYFCGAGLFVAFATARLADLGPSVTAPSEPAVVAAAGLAGGLSYWLIAGRGSGLREPARA